MQQRCQYSSAEACPAVPPALPPPSQYVCCLPQSEASRPTARATAQTIVTCTAWCQLPWAVAVAFPGGSCPVQLASPHAALSWVRNIREERRSVRADRCDQIAQRQNVIVFERPLASRRPVLGGSLRAARDGARHHRIRHPPSQNTHRRARAHGGYNEASVRERSNASERASERSIICVSAELGYTFICSAVLDNQHARMINPNINKETSDV